MTIPYTQFTEENLDLALTHYKMTGEIQDVLLVCFDQDGKWLFHPFLHVNADFGGLSQQAIPCGRIVQIMPNGEKVLLSSYFNDHESPIELDYHHIAGKLDLNRSWQVLVPNLVTIGGSMSVGLSPSFNAPNLKTVGCGDLCGGLVTTFSAPDLISVAGSIELQSATNFDAQKLKSVSGGLLVGSVTIFNAPTLRSVLGFLNAYSATSFIAPELQSVDSSLQAGAATIFDAPKLEMVNGDLSVFSAKTFNIPKLQTVFGDLLAYSTNTFHAPSLQTVKGDLNAESASFFHAPQLAKVDGSLFLESNALNAAVLAGCPAACLKVAAGI